MRFLSMSMVRSRKFINFSQFHICQRAGAYEVELIIEKSMLDSIAQRISSMLRSPSRSYQV